MHTGSTSIALIAASMVGCAAVDPPASPLAGTRWQLVSIQSMDDAQGTLCLDCNWGSATWQARAAAPGGPHRATGRLPVGPLATPRAMVPADSLAPRLASSWPYARSCVIEAGRLHLSLMAEGGILI